MHISSDGEIGEIKTTPCGIVETASDKTRRNSRTDLSASHSSPAKLHLTRSGGYCDPIVSKLAVLQADPFTSIRSMSQAVCNGDSTLVEMDSDQAKASSTMLESCTQCAVICYF